MKMKGFIGNDGLSFPVHCLDRVYKQLKEDGA